MKIYQVDAFTQVAYRGNPAAVVPLESWLVDATLQAIAAENNLPETAFYVAEEGGFHLRWFAPKGEVPLCGHATLATAHVLFEELGHDGESLRFRTRSGDLFVRRDGDRLELDFPRAKWRVVSDPPVEIAQGLGVDPALVFETVDDPNYFAVLEHESEVRAIEPKLPVLATLHPAGVVATAPGDSAEFASRYFLPSFGIDEDPVTGSIHCALAPYWGDRLGLTHLHAQQLSQRGGDLYCEVSESRVLLRGHAVTYMIGEIVVDEGRGR